VARVEREQARIELGEAASALRAGSPRRIQVFAATGDAYHAASQLERARERLAELALPRRRDDQIGDRQIDVVLLEAIEARPRLGRREHAVDTELFVALAGRPLREIRVVALARDDERREQRDALATMLAQDARTHGVLRLRLDRPIAVGAVLHAQLHVQQAQEVIELGHGRDRALASAAARALLDGDGRRNAEDRVDFRASGRLHELARVGVQGFQIPALPFGEENVEGDGALAAAAHARDDGEAVAWNVEIDVLEIVLARVVDADGVWGCRQEGLEARFRNPQPRRIGPEGPPPQSSARAAPAPVWLRCIPSPAPAFRAHDLAARVAAFGAEIDDPVGRGDHPRLCSMTNNE
jgi:hypothetical protein